MTEDTILDFRRDAEASFAEEVPERGDIRHRNFVAIDEQGLIVGIEGMKRDGIVQRKDWSDECRHRYVQRWRRP